MAVVVQKLLQERIVRATPRTIGEDIPHVSTVEKRIIHTLGVGRGQMLGAESVISLDTLRSSAKRREINSRVRHMLQFSKR